MKKSFYLSLFCLFSMPMFVLIAAEHNVRRALFIFSEQGKCLPDYIFLKEVAEYALKSNHADLFRGATPGHWFVKKDIKNFKICKKLTPPGYWFNEENAEKILTSKERLDIPMYIPDEVQEEELVLVSAPWWLFLELLKNIYCYCGDSSREE